MYRILVVGDAVVPTGFARVIHAILERLCSIYEIHHLGLNYIGDPHTCSWRIYPAAAHGDSTGVNRLGNLIKSIDPQLIFMVGDAWILMQYAGHLTRLGSRIPCIAYFPVESDPVEPDCMAHLLRSVTQLVTYTEFGAQATRHAIRQARSRHPDLPDRSLLVVSHGVDTGVFYPLKPGASREAARVLARSLLFGDKNPYRNDFIILNANRNQPRKRIDVTLQAFSLFAQNKPANVRLYLHMARQDAGWDIQRLASRLGILDRLLVTRNDNEYCREPVEKLNLIYNACDIGVNTASAEGWGLVAFEHAATGAPQIVPRHTSQPELWEHAAELVTPRFSLITENILTKAYYLDPQDVAAAMDRLYSDSDYCQRLGEAARLRATEKKFSWDSICTRWTEIFSNIINKKI